MMKRPHPAFCLPLALLLGASDAPSDARPAAPSSLSSARAHREKAKSLAESGRWQEASAEWRSVLLELHRSRARTPQSKQMSLEAEAEVRRAQGHLAAFWKVRDLVSLGVDSRNARPASAPVPAKAAPAPAVLSLAARPPIATKASTKKGRAGRPVAQRAAQSHELFTQGLTLGGLGERSAQERARWATSLWWAQPLVHVGADSLNPTLASASAEPRLSPPVAQPTLVASAILAERAPEPGKLPLPAKRSWTMEFLLPASREAALAARRDLGP